MSDPLVDGFRHLADQARVASDERDVLTTLTELVQRLDGVSNVELVDVNDGDGRMTVPVHASREIAYRIAVDGPDVPDATVGALAASASASLTARRAVRASRVDTLTRLLNRSALDAVLVEEIDRARNGGPGLAALMLDLDDFKAVNDEMGHSVGDAVLREAGAGLSATVRSCDHVARLGGDEFVILLPGGDPVAVMATADRLRRVVTRRSEAVSGRAVQCSIGIAHWSPDQLPADLLDRADVALRRAKQGGKAQATAAPPAVANGHVQVDEDWPELDDALRGRGLRVLFQPIRELSSGKLVGYEALTRGPGRLERPDALLAHARAAGRLLELDDALRKSAFAAAQEAGIRGPLSMFVNIEPETLVALADQPELWLRHGEPFPSIAEITERALFSRPGRLIAACHRLRELGWGLALDDVGQDPRALALLPLLAPDIIKLDLRLLADRPPSDLSKVLVAVTAEVQRSGARVVAEGIESDEHMERALSLGASLGQGYHLGRPGAPDAEPLANAGPPLPRSPRLTASRGITPFNLVASRAPEQRADTALLRELQADLERRALGLGPAATVATALPDVALDPGLPSRLRHLTDDVGFAVLLADTFPMDDEAFLSRPLPADHAMADEWVTVVACPQYALTLVARPTGPDRWSYALSHDNALGLQVAQRLMLELDRVGVNRG